MSAWLERRQTLPLFSSVNLHSTRVRSSQGLPTPTDLQDHFIAIKIVDKLKHCLTLSRSTLNLRNFMVRLSLSRNLLTNFA